VADHPKSDNSQRACSPGDFQSKRCIPEARAARRLEARHGVETSAVIRLINLAADVQGRILDVSLGGCHIRTDSRFPVGIFRRVEVEFRIEGLPFRLAGVTQAIYDPFNVGIRFLDMSDRKREQLQQLIDEIRQAEQTTD
jgi:c-di-GMP-binding flagellar brake protein YcgR